MMPSMTPRTQPDFEVRLAQTKDDLRAAQRLRYQVFIEELGGDVVLGDHLERLEKDRFDPFADHLLLKEPMGGRVIGVYRLIRPEQAVHAGDYYSSSEFDLSVLETSGKRKHELGRSILLPENRRGTAL